MMNTKKHIIVISECLLLQKRSVGKREFWSYHFHFKGYYAGDKVELIIVESGKKIGFEKNEAYTMLLCVREVHQKALYTNLIKYRELNSLKL